MNDTAERPGCGCARDYARRWPDMTPAELAHTHAPLCPVLLRHRQRLCQEAGTGDAVFWELLLRQQQQ